MLRDTMMRTMPVAMIAIEALWTDRFERFRGVRKLPPDMRSKPSQITPRPRSIPSSRVSISVTRRNVEMAPPIERRGGVGAVAGALVASVIEDPFSGGTRPD